MPFTPFHLGPGLFFGLLSSRYLDVPTFLVASIVLDVEPLLVMTLGLSYPLHGFFHTLFGGAIVAILLAFVTVKLNKPISWIASIFKLPRKTSLRSIVLSYISGISLHILLDSPLYSDIRPFYPWNFNPLYSDSVFVGIEIYALSALPFLAGLILYAYIALRSWKNTKKRAESQPDGSRLISPSVTLVTVKH